MRADEEYFDILQNIEATVMSFYNVCPKLTDSDVKNIYKRLLSYYRLQRRADTGREPNMSGEKGHLLHDLYAICQWRMGKGAPEGAEPLEAGDMVDLESIICCLEHLIDSLKTWQSGEGYLKYLRKFFKKAERRGADPAF